MYSGQFLKISWLFVITGTDEVADTSINYTTAPGWTGAAAALAELQTAVVGPDIIGAYSTFMSSTGIQWADYSALVGVKIAAKSTSGLDLASPYVEDSTGGPAGTVGQVLPQSTVVLSLNSGLTFGKGNFGRMYLPHTKMSLSTGFPITSSVNRDQVAEDGAIFINDVTDTINAATTAVLFPAIMSQVAPTPSGKGVTEVRVGGVNDTQRRRRNKLVEAYSVQPL